MFLTGKTSLALLSFLFAGGIPVAGADDVPATVRRVAATVTLAAQEYRIGVKDGVIVLQPEVDEAKLFLTEARRAAALLPAQGGRETVVIIDELLTLVGRTASPDSVDAKTRVLTTHLTETWHITLDEIPSVPPSLERGKLLYAQECASCHGALGRGDGVAAPSLDPRPTDLSAHVQLAGTSPLDFYRRISIGVAGTAMPAFEARLPVVDRWALALYASTLRLPPASGSVPVELRRFDATARLNDSAISAALEPGRDPLSAAVAERIAAVRRAGSLEGGGRDFGPVFAEVRDKLKTTVAQAEAGDVGSASSTAFDAYMAFEGVEPTLRAKDGGLAGRLEAQFAALRTRAAGGATEAELEELHGTLLAQLEIAERLVAAPSSRGSLFVQSLGLMLREGLEAILIIGAVLAFLTKTGATRRRRDVHVGVGAALLASLLTAVALETVFQLSGAQQEALEGLTMIVAAAMLFYVSYWLLSKIEVARWNKFVKSQVQDAVTGGSALALASVAFLAVYREGFETVFFYKALFLSGGPGSVGPIVAGLLVAAVILAFIYVAIERYGVRLPLKPFFAVTSIFLYYMAFVFAGKGIAELQAGGYVGVTPFTPEIRFPALGIYSTWETLGVQFFLVVAFLAATLWAFVIEPRRLRVTSVMVPDAEAQGRRGAAEPAAPAPAPKAVLDQDLQRSLDRMEADLAELRAELQRLRDLLTQRAIDRMTE